MKSTSFNRSLPTLMTPSRIVGAGVKAHELNPYDLALVDCDTGESVDVASYAPDKRYELVFKTASRGMRNSMFPDQFGAQLPVRSHPIARVDKSHLFDGANETQKPFVAYLGFNGISACGNLDLPCGEDYSITFTVKGKTVRNTFNGNYYQTIPFTTDCCDDCGTNASPESIADTILEAFETAPFYLKNFVKLEKVVKSCTPELPFERTFCQTYELEVCNNGTGFDMAAVQRQYQDSVFEVSRSAPYTIYGIKVDLEFTTPDQNAIDTAKTALDAETIGTTEWDTAKTAYDTAVQTAVDNAKAAQMPADFTMSRVKPLVCDECPDCPTSFTKVDGGFGYVVAVSDTDGTEGADTDVETFAQSLNIPGYIANSAKFVGCSKEGVTTITVVTDAEIPATPIANLKFTSTGEVAGYCEGSATVAWCPKDTEYRIQRKMCIILQDDECGETYLDELVKVMSEDDSVVEGSVVVKSTNNCVTEYELTQMSSCVADGCDVVGKDGAKFSSLTSFEGKFWKECDCDGWTFDASGCPVAPETSVMDKQAGIKITGALIGNDEISDCTFDINDNIDREPLEIEVTIAPNVPVEDMICAPLEIPFEVVQWGQGFQGSGRYLSRTEVISRQYENYVYTNPRSKNGKLIEDRLGYEYSINPAKFYNTITLWHDYVIPRTHSSNRDWEREQIIIAVDKDNVTLLQELKDFFNKTLLSHGHMKLL